MGNAQYLVVIFNVTGWHWQW